jgi:hypothetical protein
MVVDYYTILLLGYEVSQKKTVNLGVYTLKFHRKKIRKGKEVDFLYIVELIRGGEVVEKGVFTEYSNAVVYAGEIFCRFR